MPFLVQSLHFQDSPGGAEADSPSCTRGMQISWRGSWFLAQHGFPPCLCPENCGLCGPSACSCPVLPGFPRTCCLPRRGLAHLLRRGHLFLGLLLRGCRQCLTPSHFSDDALSPAGCPMTTLQEGLDNQILAFPTTRWVTLDKFPHFPCFCDSLLKGSVQRGHPRAAREGWRPGPTQPANDGEMKTVHSGHNAARSCPGGKYSIGEDFG